MSKKKRDKKRKSVASDLRQRAIEQADLAHRGAVKEEITLPSETMTMCHGWLFTLLQAVATGDFPEEHLPYITDTTLDVAGEWLAEHGYTTIIDPQGQEVALSGYQVGILLSLYQSAQALNPNVVRKIEAIEKAWEAGEPDWDEICDILEIPVEEREASS